MVRFMLFADKKKFPIKRGGTVVFVCVIISMLLLYVQQD